MISRESLEYIHEFSFHFDYEQKLRKVGGNLNWEISFQKIKLNLPLQIRKSKVWKNLMYFGHV